MGDPLDRAGSSRVPLGVSALIHRQRTAASQFRLILAQYLPHAPTWLHFREAPRRTQPVQTSQHPADINTLAARLDDEKRGSHAQACYLGV